MRLNRYLAHSGVTSRRKADTLISSGAVAINGKVVRELGTLVTPGKHTVTVNGKRITEEQKVLYRFFKPAKVVSTISDPEGRPCVGDYLKKSKERLYPIGRLDFDAFGLLLITNDGDLADRMMHPKFNIQRTYWAEVLGKVSIESLKRLTSGVKIDGRHSVAKQAKFLRRTAMVKSLFGNVERETTFVAITVVEGRKHFVKRLFKEIGHPVKHLCRVSFGEHELGSLDPGEMRRVELRTGDEFL